MTEPRVTVFVNERPLRVPSGTTATRAVEVFDPALAARLAGHEAYVTDGRGVRIALDAVLEAGAILRVVVTARRSTDADAHA